MATQNVNIGINVSDNGTAKKVVKNFQEIESAASKAQRAAAGIGAAPVKSTMAPGGTSGSRKAAEPTGSQQMSGQQYGSARGSAGLTGASARDFANQAQGLGGLVRLYATYAANVFAVSAAFTALSNAMDTTNMIRGLDQLGAATGRNLGGLSKRLVEITDGAISFKDSMDAVAKTTSAGMASKDVERLAMVAKNASLALGVAMPDAMNRLSRGITKLEPELLDELGIFTKIDPAVQAYSRAVGKAASQLTDFERRQAFANAVLLEGEAKFGELASAAVNPYDKLLASLKNVTQQALEVVNNVLGPMVSLLASSPGALAGALAVLGTVLLRQAIPALTEFKAGLASAADAATEVAKGKAEDAKAARARIDKDIIAEVENRAAKEIDAVDRAEQKIRDLRKAGYKKDSLAARLLSQDLDDIRKEDLAKQDEIARRLESRATRMAKDPAADPKTVQNAQRAAEANREVVTTLTAAKVAQEEFFRTEKRLIEQAETAAKGRSVYGLTIQASLNAQDAATKKSIVSNAAYNASLIGMTGAFRLMNAEIAKAGLSLNTFQLALLKTKAGLAMLVGVVGTLSAVINGLLGAIGMVAAVVGIFDSVFSKASKELDAFNSVLTKVDDAAANAARTLAHLDKKGGYATGTIDGITAMANAFVELASSAKEAVDSATVALAKMGTWDKIKDAIFSTFGGGVEKNLAKALTKDVTSALNLLTKSGLGEEARKTFKDILGVDSLDTESVNNAILKLSDSAKNKLVTALSEANTQLNISASRLQSFKSASESTTKAYQDFILSTANTNPLFRVGSNLENLAKSMESIALGGAKEMEAAMISLAESPQQGVLFGSEFTNQLVGLRKGFLDQAAAVTAYENTLQDLDKQIETTSATMSGLQEGTRARSVASQDLAQLKKDRDVIQKTLDLLPREKIVAARDLFNKGLDNAFTEGSRLISVGLGQAAEKAAQTIAKANLGGLSGENLAREQLRINQKDIDIQISAIDTNINLILSQERLRASIDLSNAKAASAQARQDNRPQEVQDRLKAGELAAEGMVALLGQRGTPNLRGTRDQLAQRAGITDNPDAARILANQALGLNAQIGAQLASRREQQGARTAANVTGQREITQGSVQDLNKAASLEQAITSQQQARLGILTSISGISTKESVVRQNMFEISTLSTRQMEEQRNINAAITNAGSDEEELKQEGYKRLILIRQEEELRNLFLQNRQRLLQAEIEQIGRRTELERSGAELQNTLRTTALETQSQELALYNSAYDVSRQVQITQQSSLDIQKAQLETSTAVAQAQAALQQKREEAQARLNTLGEGEEGKAQEINTELARQVSLTNNTIAGLNAQGAAKTSILEKTRDINLEQERYNLLLQNSETIASSLSEVFGELGASLGGLTKAFTEIAVNSEKRAKAEELANKNLEKAWESMDYNAVKNAEDAVAKTRKKNAREALADDIKAVNSTKKLFSEKTFAYKALDKIEKAMHLFRMASMIKEVAMDIWKTGQSVVNSAIRIGKDVVEAGVAGVKAVLNQGGGDPYTAIPRMAAMATIVAGLLSQIGGKGPSVGGGGAAENDGTGTVLGDKTAKSTAVKQTIEVLQDSDPVLMRNSTNMLKHLRSIDDNILAFGASLARSVGAGDVAERMGVQQGLRAGNTGTTLAFGLPLNKLPIVGGLFESLAKGLGFGKKTSVRGQGLELGSQTLGEAAMGGVDAGFYADVNTKVKALGITLDSYTKRQRLAFGEQDRDLQVALDRTFEGVFSSALAASETFGISQADMRARLIEYELKAQAIPLKGTIEEQQQQLLASIGKITDQVFLDLLPQATKFQKTGETYVTTVGRVVYGTEQASVLLDNLGIEAIKFTEIANKQGDVGAEIVRQSIVAQESGNNFIREVIDSMTGTAEDIAELYTALDTMRDRVVDFGGSAQFVSEATARAAGGADQLGEAITSFYDKFTSAGQKAAVNNQKVTELFDSLNVTLPKTRAEVLGLVNSLTRTDPAAAAKIMTATDALDSFYSKLDDLQSEERDLRIELMRLTGDTQGANAALRLLAIDGMTQAEIAAYDFNQTLKQLATDLSDAMGGTDKALDGVKTAAARVETDYQTSVRNTDTAFNNARASIDAAKNSLQKYIGASDKAYSALQRAADAERKNRETQLASAEATRDLLTSIFETVTSTVQEILIGVTSTSAEQVANAREILAQASQGNLPTAEVFSEAVGTVKTSIENTSFASKTDRDYALLVFANQLTNLEKNNKPQLTAAEAAVEYQKDQLQKLDLQLELAQKQIDEMNGVSTEVMSVDQAARRLQTAIADERNAKRQIDYLDSQLTNLSSIVAATRGTETKITSVTTAIKTLETALGAEGVSKTRAEEAKKALDKAQEMVDELRGNNAALLSLASSMDTLGAAIGVEIGAREKAAAAAAAVSAAPAITATDRTSAVDARLAEADVAGQKYVETYQANVESNVKSIIASFTTSSGTDWAKSDAAVVAWANANFVPAAAVAKAIGTTLEGILAIAASRGLEFKYKTGSITEHYSPPPAGVSWFADGGSYPGGLAVVGEEGPELINFKQPGMVYTAAQTGSLLNNEQVVAELRALREEVVYLRAETRANVSHNAKTAKLLDRVVKDGESLQVTVAA